MGLTIETLKTTFPRSAEALGKVHRYIDALVIPEVERAQLKTQVALLVLLVATEASGVEEKIRAFAPIMQGLFRKKGG